jgi:peroxiredoxin/outer membrane lipoprotein-sorting protein
MRFCCTTAVILSLALSCVAGAEDITSAPPSLIQFSAQLARANTITCRFSEQGGDDAKTAWELAWVRPNQFRIEAKGKNAWCCVSDGQRMHHPEMPMSDAPESLGMLAEVSSPWAMAMLTQFFAEEPFADWMERATRVDVGKDANGAERISMAGLLGNPEAALEITFTDGLPATLSMAASEAGVMQTRTLKFSRWKFDGDVPAARFDLKKIPKKAEKVATIPNITLDTLDGEKLAMRPDGGKRVLVLDFFASWCKPCGESLKRFQALTKRFAHTNVQFVAVNLREGSDKIRSFMKKNEVDAQVALDEDGKLAEALQVNAFPTTVVIGPDGVVELKKEGLDEGWVKSLETKLKSLVGATPR